MFPKEGEKILEDYPEVEHINRDSIDPKILHRTGAAYWIPDSMITRIREANPHIPLRYISSRIATAHGYLHGYWGGKTVAQVKCKRTGEPGTIIYVQGYRD